MFLYDVFMEISSKEFYTIFTNFYKAESEASDGQCEIIIIF